MAPTLPKKSTGMMIDGIFASEAIDSSGEIVSIEGMDVSTMEEGYGTANFEHQGDDSGGFGRETVGKIVYVKKIFKESDCENDRQRKYCKQIKGIPFLYGVVRLYDGAGHEGAKALAAQIRDHVANDEPIIVRYSIEGTTVEKDGNKIKSSLAKRVALTIKPCNRTCVSGVISDPNAPEGFSVVEKSEGVVDPEFMTLGTVVEIECNPCIDEDDALNTKARLLAAAGAVRAMAKAIAAGTTDAAPSTLGGGAALQKEHTTHFRNQMLAALRDYPDRFSRDGFKKFVKAKLPEVSEDFLQHFIDVAEAYHLKKSFDDTMAKTEAMARKAVRGRPPSQEKPLVEDVSDATEAMPDEAFESKGQVRRIDAGTVRGKPLAPNKGLVNPQFDPAKGVLHTPIGSFRAYLPRQDGWGAGHNYQKILSDPQIEGAMDQAIGNWTKVHKLLKAGKLPPEVVMHAVMFSQLSPNKPVPVQELQYARLVDAMKGTGLDPRKPGFEQIERPWRGLDSTTELPQTGREAFRTSPAYYVGGKIGVERDPEGNKVGKPTMTGRYPGELNSISPLANDFLGRAVQYHQLHEGLLDLVSRHRHHGFDAIAELMDSKRQAQNYQNTRRAALQAGKPDPGPFKGLTVPGLKVKTGLYTYGMMGGGDSVVPDTHFIRNMYGLDLKKDANTIEYLKNLHWRPTNMELMKNFNQWYAQNHPAVEYTVNHPKWGSAFERREDALFPSFWRHWLTIAPHERALGMPNQSAQAGTTHAPYWEAIAPHVDPLLKGEGNQDPTIPLRTALVHQQYVKDFGEVPAQMMFYRFLVPKLLEAAEHRERYGKDMQFLAKARTMEAALVDLRKSVREALEGPSLEMPEVRFVKILINGNLHPAGRFMVHHGKVTHLEDYHGILKGVLPQGSVDAGMVSRIHGLEFAPHLVVSPHEAPTESGTPEPTLSGQLQVEESPVPPRPPVFEYHRPGMETPHVVEFSGGRASLDGRELSPDELQLMLDNVDNGLAMLRYRKGAESLAKAEEDMDPESALAGLDAAVEAGHVHPSVAEDVRRRLQALRQHVFQDPMTPGIGNAYAWQQFKAKGRPGVYLSIDGNSMKQMNDTYGHSAGDEAIRGYGSALRDAAAKLGTGKVFRSGGDEFVAHFPTYEDASTFVRHATHNLDQVPALRGTHRLSMAFGLGNSYEQADHALYRAKEGKKDPVTGGRLFPPGKDPHLAHSLVPGAEGAIPLHQERPPKTTLPAQAQPRPTVEPT